MKCTIFELDKDRTAREQGGMIDLHANSGQLALHEAGLFEEFLKHSLPAAESQKLIKSDGRIMWDENNTKNPETGPSRNRPEIDRSTLRDILLDSIQPGSIQWNRKLVRVEPINDAKHKYNLHFIDGAEEGFDLVVGADGAWSKVRPLLTDQLPFYSGISGIELKAFNVSEKKQWLSEFTGRGSCFMFDKGRAVVCQHNGNDTIRVYVAVRQPETWVKDCGIDWEQPDAARAILAERYYGDCHEDIKRVIIEASDGLIPRPLYMLPVGFRWSPRPGVTLLGDAAHLMTPFAGVGVNVALADALGLARALLKRKDSFEAGLYGNIADALQEYEGPMFERAKENMEKTMVGLKFHFSADGIEHRVRRLSGRGK
jgi:2-polyprenyl-6-methoxyphenol hydroxylase-like FAD-dependent oxidoreductase